MLKSITARWLIFLAGSLTLFFGNANAAIRIDSSMDVVVTLYRDFSSEVVLNEPSLPVLWVQPAHVWAKYFSTELVDLHSRVVECEAKAEGICGREVSPIWFTQDPSGITVSLRKTSTDAVVLADIHYSGVAAGSDKATLEYRLKVIGNKWKIVDIAYSDGTTFKGWLLDALK